MRPLADIEARLDALEAQGPLPADAAELLAVVAPEQARDFFGAG
mgnify:CR=1 FL=1